MRLIDADELRNEVDNYDFSEYSDYSNMIDMIDDAPAIEYVTHEQFCNAVNEFFNEFKENGADEETLAKCIFIGLAFSNLERRLFGSGDGGTNA